ncbi:MAG: GIY-YIG nuclease family protein [Flavobacteriales bacterium]|jgi:putative endonuclease|nr:GIY-YIG nuclease family protein [Flavobacteriales bacterium]MBK6552028.1 GIY-YIG nuclease family protein [Flavobacteriales bacterium]MBK6883328.1 GIY-YIG nuclease family protein [Flavobacteriales bacterium]MBK7102970.1 GIY-YIG nuclease family protein [Flavobacteriales bacterium]MBK7113928.1 GIY-YIG nuclease family protein [Flavobacteriales bacterium]
MASCWTYAISSLSANYIYVGLCNDAQARIARHQGGRERTTRPYRPFVVLITEEYVDRTNARTREKYLKSGVGKDYLRGIRDKL